MELQSNKRDLLHRCLHHSTIDPDFHKSTPGRIRSSVGVPAKRGRRSTQGKGAIDPFACSTSRESLRNVSKATDMPILNSMKHASLRRRELRARSKTCGG